MKRLIYILLFLPLTGWGQVDSYPESNASGGTYISCTGRRQCQGQSFYCSANSVLDSCKFYGRIGGSPTGSVYALVFAHSGTYGTSSVPTGSALATSDAVNIATIGAGSALIKFTFTGAQKINLSASTNYVVVVTYNGGDATNGLRVNYGYSSPTHGGNYVYSDDCSSWRYNNLLDDIFYVYGSAPSTQIKKISGISEANTKKVAGVADANIKKIGGKTK